MDHGSCSGHRFAGRRRLLADGQGQQPFGDYGGQSPGASCADLFAFFDAASRAKGGYSGQNEFRERRSLLKSTAVEKILYFRDPGKNPVRDGRFKKCRRRSCRYASRTGRPDGDSQYRRLVWRDRTGFYGITSGLAKRSGCGSAVGNSEILQFVTESCGGRESRTGNLREGFSGIFVAAEAVEPHGVTQGGCRGRRRNGWRASRAVRSVCRISGVRRGRGGQCFWNNPISCFLRIFGSIRRFPFSRKNWNPDEAGAGPRVAPDPP